MVRVRPEPVEITLAAALKTNEEVPQVYQAPGGLYPLRAKAFELEEYRLMAGWPVPIPRYDIFANTLVSASGEVLADRLNPATIRTGALARWIADEEFYDITALRWSPVQDDTTGIYWTSSTDGLPVLIDDYTYRLGGEVFVHPALNFDSDSAKYLSADLSSTLGGANGYTVVMVFSPNSSYGNSLDVPYGGLWCPTAADATSYVSATVEGDYLYYADEAKARTRALSISTGLSSNAPVYLAMVFSRPETSFYVGEGPAAVRIKTMPTGTTESVSLDGHVTIGSIATDRLHNIDMALLDLGIYGEALEPAAIATEFASLAQAYGGVDQ